MQDQDDRLEQAAPATPSAGQLLRQQAEEITPENAAQAPENIATMSLDETRRLLHEPRMYQLELELQNEELRRAQLELQTSRAEYIDLYDLAPVGYVTLSEQGLILKVNLTAAVLLGMPRSQLVKQPLSRFIVPNDANTYHRYHRQLWETKTPQACDLQLVNMDETPFWAHLQATVAQDGKTNKSVCSIVISDITDRKRLEEEIRAAKYFLEVIVGSSPVPIVVHDLQGNVVQWNPAAERLLGWSASETLNKPPPMIPPEHQLQFRETLSTVFKEDRLFLEEVPVLRKDGSTLLCQIAVGLLRGAQSEIRGMVTILNDVTRRKQAEQEIRKLNAELEQRVKERTAELSSSEERFRIAD